MKNKSAIIYTFIAVLLVGVLSYGCANLNSTNPNLSSVVSVANNQLNQKASGKTDTDFNNPNFSEKNAALATSSTTNITNNASLANNNTGTGQNKADLANGYVREDVRHILQSKFSNYNELQAALRGAALLQSYLDQPKQNAIALMQQYDCTVVSLTQADQNLIKMLTFDTQQRQNLLRQGLQNYQPPVSTQITIDEQGNAISPCQSL